MPDVFRSKSQASGLRLLHFVVGVGLSGLLLFPMVSLSLWMTHTSPMDLNLGQISIAFLIPLASGVFSVLYPRRMERFLDAIADMTHTLPF